MSKLGGYVPEGFRVRPSQVSTTAFVWVGAVVASGYRNLGGRCPSCLVLGCRLWGNECGSLRAYGPHGLFEAIMNN